MVRHASLFEDTSWIAADFVYCCNVAFPDEMTEKIAGVWQPARPQSPYNFRCAEMAADMKPGAIIVTVMVPLPSKHFRVLEVCACGLVFLLRTCASVSGT